MESITFLSSTPTPDTNPRSGEPKVVLLKDSWRREIDPKQAFGGHGGNMAGGGHQMKPIQRSRVPPRLSRRTSQHSRLMVECLDIHLKETGTIRYAVTALRDAGEAQAVMVKKANSIHGDISATSIRVRITRDKTQEITGVMGILIDWDIGVDSGNTDTAKTMLRMRAGTLYFLPATLYSNIWPSRLNKQNRFDDVESLFNVLVYFASHFPPHRGEVTEAHKSFIFDYFCAGGLSKIGCIVTGGRPLVQELQCQPLQRLIGCLANGLAARYLAKEGKEIDLYDPESSESEGDEVDDETQPVSLGNLEDPEWFVRILTNGLALKAWDGQDGPLMH